MHAPTDTAAVQNFGSLNVYDAGWPGDTMERGLIRTTKISVQRSSAGPGNDRRTHGATGGRTALRVLSAAMAFNGWVAPALSATGNQDPVIELQLHYDIAAGNLRDALDRLAVQGNAQIIYSPELVAGKNVEGIQGRFVREEALRRLLAGTGLTWQAVGEATFVLQALPGKRQDNGGTIPDRIVRTPRTLDAMNVSGSLINNTLIQTATPTYTVTAEDIKSRGFSSVADVLQSNVLVMGSVQGPQVPEAFTQGAQTLQLLGLNPQFTLLLLDGKPLANFGRLYTGSVNFTNIANIPVSMIDHIDMMPGGSSSIYGSRAIAGVINIVTRQHMDGGEVSVRTGNYADGGGANQRVSFMYGHDVGKLNVLGAAEFRNASPIWAYQRARTRSTEANPDGLDVPGVQSAIFDLGTIQTYDTQIKGYRSPPAGCDRMLFGNTTKLFENGSGSYCGSSKVPSQATYSNQERSYNGMLKLTYDASDNLRLYAGAMLDWQQQKWYTGAPLVLFYPAFVDIDTGHIMGLRKGIAPEEVPDGFTGQMARQKDLLYQANIGATGQLGGSDWQWDVYYTRSGDRTKLTKQVSITSEITRFFSDMIGPVLGRDPATNLDFYRPDYPAFFRAITPEQYASFTHGIGEFSNTWVNDTRATISNPRLFGLPGGDAGFAVLLEGGNEVWNQPINPLYVEDEAYVHSATGGGGERSHTASAFQLNLPLLQPLTLDLSGRYDHYTMDKASNNHKLTYKIGIEYRPLDTLMLRGNYTTGFKAPDLASLFLLRSARSYSSVTDYYRCALTRSSLCRSYLVEGGNLANRQLLPTESRSWTTGIVWSPFNELVLSADYLHIDIRNEVVAQDQDALMIEEAQCRLGQLDANSAECQALTNPVDGQIQRAATGPSQNIPGPVQFITTHYENLASEAVNSIIASGRYRFDTAHLGSFGVQMDYNNILKHTYQPESGEPTVDQLADPRHNAGFKSIVSGALNWTSPGRRWKSTVYGHRYGATPNAASMNYGAGRPGSGRVHPWITFNGSLSYAPTDNLELSLLVNNIANKMPPTDATYTAYPYFNSLDYNIYGRQVMLQASLKFGGRTN